MKTLLSLLSIIIISSTSGLFAQIDSNFLEVEGSILLRKTGPSLSRLILHTDVLHDPGRSGLLFSNNHLAPFLGQDLDHQTFGFYSAWDHTRTYDAILNIHGRSTNNWGVKLSLTHNGSYGKISTDLGPLVLTSPGKIGLRTTAPIDDIELQGKTTIDGNGGLSILRLRQNDSLRWSMMTAPWLDNNDFRIKNEVANKNVITIDQASSNVGILTTDPTSPLTVDGAVELTSGYLEYPDDSKQFRAGQVTFSYQTNTNLIGANSSGTIAASCPSGYRVMGGGWDQNTTPHRPFYSDLFASVNAPNGQFGWKVTIRNTANYIVAIDVTAICAPYQ